jgi:hypothetical protein
VPHRAFARATPLNEHLRVLGDTTLRTEQDRLLTADRLPVETSYRGSIERYLSAMHRDIRTQRQVRIMERGQAIADSADSADGTDSTPAQPPTAPAVWKAQQELATITRPPHRQERVGADDAGQPVYVLKDARGLPTEVVAFQSLAGWLERGMPQGHGLRSLPYYQDPDRAPAVVQRALRRAPVEGSYNLLSDRPEPAPVSSAPTTPAMIERPTAPAHHAALLPSSAAATRAAASDPHARQLLHLAAILQPNHHNKQQRLANQAYQQLRAQEAATARD